MEPHITVQKRNEDLPLQKCVWCCSNYHCPFCATDVFKPGMLSKLKRHLLAHKRRAVRHKGYSINKCNLHCVPTTHFHCVYCTSTYVRRDAYMRHLKKCPSDPSFQAASEKKVRRSQGKKVRCPLCSLMLNANYLKNHLARKHSQYVQQLQPTIVPLNNEDYLLAGSFEPDPGSASPQSPTAREYEQLFTATPTPVETPVHPAASREDPGGRKRRAELPEGQGGALADVNNPLDEDEHFFMSLVPVAKRLTPKKRAEIKVKIMQILVEAEFGDDAQV